MVSVLFFGLNGPAISARRRIAQMAGTLELTAHHVDAATRLYILAIQHNFVQGRRAEVVCATCLYIACRREKTASLWGSSKRQNESLNDFCRAID